jgi:hypothetical protein
MNTELDRQKAREYAREYRKKNRLIIREKNKLWKQANPEKSRAYVRKWQKDNPDYMREQKRRYKKTETGKRATQSRRAKRRALEMGVEAETVSYKRLYKERPVNCAYCNEPMPDELILDIDHIIPLGQGGGHVKTNLQVIHMWCHRVKTQEERTGKKENWIIPKICAPADLRA